jgi:Putative transposase/Transposase zinc-binding domain
LELADIVRTHIDALRQQVSLSTEQARALADIARCRTSALGGFLYECPDCSFEQPQYCSCGNRHCPKCQVLEQQQWVEQRLDKVLPVAHFHVVFTLPSQLRAVVRYQSEALYSLLMRAAADTILEFAKHPQRPGAVPCVPGITQVLHTWTRELHYHPHVHSIVTAGGLSLDGLTWVQSSKKFLFAVKAMGKVFNGKFRDGLRKLKKSGALRGFQDFDDPQGFDRLMQRLAKLDWCVYAKKTLREDAHVFRYLAQYTHRVGIANSRLLSMRDGNVTFRSKEGKQHTVTGVEFLRRFIKHVLPRGYVKIRHYGLYASGNVPTKLAQARTILTAEVADTTSTVPLPAGCWQAEFKKVTGRDICRCPRCGSLAWRWLSSRATAFAPPSAT